MRRWVIAGWLTCAVVVSRGQASPQLCQPGDVIARIVIERVPVFDPAVPGENKPFFRLVNKLHSPMQTRLGTVRSLLTVKEGEPCDPERLREAERTLRSYGFIQDAWVEADYRDGHDVTVLVRVRDAWSTRARVSFKHQGGASESTFKVLENNLLGTGTTLAWERSKDQDRTESLFQFRDPSVLGSRWVFEADMADNSDGHLNHGRIALPFWRLEASRSADFGFTSQLADRKVYDGGDEVARWELDREDDWIRLGMAPFGLRGNQVFRWYAGLSRRAEDWTYRRKDVPGFKPPDSDLTMLEGTLQWQRIDYRRVYHYLSARRIEDFDLGTTLQATAKVAIPGVSEDGGGEFSAVARHGFEVGDGTFFVLDASQVLRNVESTWFASSTRLDAECYRRLAFRHTLVFAATAAHGSRIPGPDRHLLGGDTGLRGYPSREFSGSDMLLAKVEHRYFAPWEAFHLLRFGLVSFFEAGGAWDEDRPLSWAEIHPDIGVGLRAQLLRSSGATTIHFNVAYPLDPNGVADGRGWEFSVLTAGGF
ncbi:MAG: hypothetical protein KBD01_09990 [Acidobacteria bacterium]|nr:hypothetical protein [Acidobacteriota bacterium]